MGDVCTTIDILGKREELARLGKRKAILGEKTSSKCDGRRKKLTACPSCHLTHNVLGAGGRHHFVAVLGDGGDLTAVLGVGGNLTAQVHVKIIHLWTSDRNVS